MEAGRTLDRSDLRAQLHAMWDGVAPAWRAHADFIDARGLEITSALLYRSQPTAGERVLELAAGPGSVGIAAAGLVGAEGEVVISDVSPQMTAIAAERASWQTSARRCSTSSGSQSRTRPSTSCSAGKG